MLPLVRILKHPLLSYPLLPCPLLSYPLLSYLSSPLLLLLSSLVLSSPLQERLWKRAAACAVAREASVVQPLVRELREEARRVTAQLSSMVRAFWLRAWETKGHTAVGAPHSSDPAGMASASGTTASGPDASAASAGTGVPNADGEGAAQDTEMRDADAAQRDQKVRLELSYSALLWGPCRR